MLASVPQEDHPQASIDWASAEVEDGQLTVALSGEPNAAWAKRAQAVVERLQRPGSGWGAVKVAKGRIRVKDVAAGAEEDLRHVLDGAVQQANADYAPSEQADDEDDGERSDADGAMTEAFRSFADEAPEDGAQDS
jgi:hypothetical protein